MAVTDMEHMRETALGRVQASSALHREAGSLLTDAMRAYMKAGGTIDVLMVETGLTLSVVRSIVNGKRMA